MSEAKHTPGPMAVLLAILDEDATLLTSEHRRMAEAAVADVAHARLIAAAPDLLEACLAAVAFGSQGDTHDGLSVSEILRAAIAKATGQ